MKKTTTLLLFGILAPFLLLAQSNLNSLDATSYISGDTSSHTSHVKIINTSSDTIWVKVSQDNSGAASGHVSYFCWGVNCYPPSVMLSPNPVMILPGDTNTSFVGYLNPAGHTGISVISYDFFNRDSVDDYVTVAFTYDISLGINEPLNSVSLSKPSPNPANSLTSISYDLKTVKNGQLVLYNILGSKMSEIRLTEKKETLILPTSQLSSGVYFYSIVSEGKILSTQKLIVDHR